MLLDMETDPRSSQQAYLHGRRVIVAGYGVVGRCVADRLEKDGAEVVVVELNLDTIEKQLDQDRLVVYGDIAEPDILRKAGIETAAALILAVPDDEAAWRACTQARRLSPGIFIAARTNHVSKGLMCTNAGADEVVIEEIVTAEAMEAAVVRRLIDNAPES